jgi:hypothetical protein
MDGPEFSENTRANFKFRRRQRITRVLVIVIPIIITISIILGALHVYNQYIAE